MRFAWCSHRWPSSGGTARRSASEVISKRPSAYFADQLPSALTAVFNFDMGAAVARTAVLPCAAYLTLEQLQRVLTAWSDNAQCWGRYMTDYAVQFYFATPITWGRIATRPGRTP
jgi:hypothetical protein